MQRAPAQPFAWARLALALTNLDGDTIFALSTWDAPVTLPRTTGANLTDMIGAAAADAMVLAILDAAAQSPSVPNWPSASEASAVIKAKPHS